MTVCNMTIEGGGRAGMVAPDDTTFEWVEGRPGAPEDFEAAVEDWRGLPSDEGASFDTEVEIDAAAISPAGELGHEPGDGRRRDLRGARAAERRATGARSSTWASRRARRSRRSGSTASSWARAPTRASATCARRPRWCKGRRVASSVDAMVVPGSAKVKAQAEAEGLDEVFRDAGFDWRSAGLLDVPRDEPGHARARASAAPRPRTATSRAVRAAAGAPTWSARRWPRPPPSRGASWTSGSGR